MSSQAAGEFAPEPIPPSGRRTPPPPAGKSAGAGAMAGVQQREAGDVLEVAHEARLLQAGRMLAGIVHEIRNPLAVIQGYAQLLQETLEEASDADDVGRIIQETKRLGALVDDMLSFVRRDAGTGTGSLDLARAVQAALNLTTHAMRQSGVTVVANIPEAGCHVKGQQGAFIQVLLNLLDNARESLEESETTARGIVLRVDERAESWQLDVSNNGPSIPPAMLESVFDSFVTTKQEGAGTGLGLALCREILERFGGSIRVLAAEESESSVTFRLELPKA